MRNRQIIIILLCGIALCLLLLWCVQRRGCIFSVEPKTKTVLLEHPLDSVDHVTVERGDTRIGLRRKEGRWGLAAPFSAQVDPGGVARLLDVFESAFVKDALTIQELRKRELSLKELGLSPARMHVVLESPSRRDEFLFGAFSPLGSEVFLRMNQTDQILIVSSSLYDAVPKTADDLRSRKLVHGNRALARVFEIRTPGKPFITLSKDTGTWRMVQPAPAPASDTKVEALLDTLYDARVAYFVWPTVSNVMDVAEAESAVKTRMGLYGLGSDSGIQIQVLETGSEQPLKITLGHSLDVSAGLTYALLQGGEAIGAVSNAVVEKFRLSSPELRDPRLFYGLPSGVRRFQVYFGDALFVLTQTNSLWRIEAPVADAADQSAVQDTVERLLRLTAVAIDDVNMSEATRITNEQSLPISHVELFSEQASWRFSITPDDIEGTFLNITFTNSPTVFRVANSNVPPALVSMIGLLELRDKTVLNLPSASLRRISVKRNDGKVETVERPKGDGIWHLGPGGVGRIATGNLDALVACLEHLDADRIESLGATPSALDTYGLRVPWLEVSVDVEAQDALRKTILVGKDAGFGKRYAMVRGLDALFVLDQMTLETLEGRLVEPL